MPTESQWARIAALEMIALPSHQAIAYAGPDEDPETVRATLASEGKAERHRITMVVPRFTSPDEWEARTLAQQRDLMMQQERWRGGGARR